jgi:hypothetical protein
MVVVHLPGIKVAKKKLANGTIRKYHYAYKGGPIIWRSDWPYKAGSAEYLRAYRLAHEAAGDTATTREL